jgi:membrane-associated protease RseP (regulator of RpoE activity)
MGKELSIDTTQIKNVANPSGLKKASGDSAAGMDPATVKAVAENLVVNGMIDLSAIQMIERSTLSHLNNNNITSVSSSQKVDKRSEKIQELALGMKTSNFDHSKTNSLGDMMCELMVLMIQSTSDRRQMEREMQAVLSVAQLTQSKEIAEKIMQKMQIEVEQMKDQALTQAITSSVSAAVSFGATFKPTQGGSSIAIQRQMNVNQITGLVNSASAITQLASVDNIKKIASLDADITKSRTTMALTRSVAGSVESSLRSIDSVRDQLLSTMSQIAQALHDNKMQIIRNSVI